MAVDFSKLPIGTRVETAYGPGKIVLGLSPRVTVRVGDVDYQYTPSGKRCEYDKRPTLFVAPFEWPEQEQPLPDLAVDTPVMVRVRGDRPWQRRHFCRWEHGRCVTFTDGFSSWSTKTICRWDEWRLPTDEELGGADNVE
jgi:putative SOS response-associated peptidase YedK